MAQTKSAYVQSREDLIPEAEFMTDKQLGLVKVLHLDMEPDCYSPRMHRKDGKLPAEWSRLFILHMNHLMFTRHGIGQPVCPAKIGMAACLGL